MEPSPLTKEAPMQAHPFDSLAKVLGRTETRRGAVRALSSAVAAAILAGRQHRPVAAQFGTCPSSSPFGELQTLEECFQFGGSRCVDTSSDPEHCGSCDHACREDQTCVAGRCICTPSSSLFAQGESLEECIEAFGSPKCVDISS